MNKNRVLHGIPKFSAPCPPTQPISKFLSSAPLLGRLFSISLDWMDGEPLLIAAFSALWLQLSHTTYVKWQSKITSFCQEEAVLNSKHFYMKFQLHTYLITNNLIFCACNFS